MAANELHRQLDNSKQQKRILFFQYRFTPYFIILLFSIAITGIRIYLLPDWSLWIHAGMLLIQATMLTLIWHLIKYLNEALDKKMPFEEGPIARISLQVAITLLILAPVVTLAFKIAIPYLPFPVNKQFLAIVIMLFVVVIFLFNFAFLAFYFFRNWQESVEEKAELQIQTAGLEREKVYLQYHRLKNQVNPHYLFNTLTSLDGLIHTNPELASEFVRHMSKVYRYVLQHKENEIVSLEEELDFIGHYIELLQIRYNDGLSIHHNISLSAKDRGIVMVTLQLLIDNAVKHNSIQASSPLKIIIWDENDYLVIYNNKQVRKQIETSNGQGLSQLKQLYNYLTDLPVMIDDNHEHYTIKIPLL